MGIQFGTKWSRLLGGVNRLNPETKKKEQALLRRFADRLREHLAAGMGFDAAVEKAMREQREGVI